MVNCKEVRLIDAPVGLLMYKNRLLMKTEYGCYFDGVYSPDCYIVESGEVFIGGTDNAEYRNNLMVTSIDLESLRPTGKWRKHGDGYFDEFGDWVQPVKCSRCGNIEYHTGTYCSDCGALMEDNYES